MSTRATIIFKDEYGDGFYVYRHCDGFPDIIIPDIKDVIEQKKDSWAGSDVECLVTSFLLMKNNIRKRVPDYTITYNIHTDESYIYIVEYIKQEKKWIVRENNKEKI